MRVPQSCTNVFHDRDRFLNGWPCMTPTMMYGPTRRKPVRTSSAASLKWMVRGSLVLRMSLALPVDMRPLRGRDLAAPRPGEQRQPKTGGGMRPDLPCPLGGCDAVSDLGDDRLVQEALDFALAIALDPLGRFARES
jgi:hypothetical protein